jgi:tetratricopeptide (TPR) repeat protein
LGGVFTLLTVLGLLGASAQDKPEPAEPTSEKDWPASVLNPLVPTPTPPLPEGGGMGVGVDDYENPLLLFQDNPDGLPMAEDLNPDLLPPLTPLAPERPIPLRPDPAPPTAAEKRLMTLGAKVATSVVGVRVWDEFGAELASGIGSWVSDDGVLLTDAGLLHPEWASNVDYITLTAADGKSSKVTGFYVCSQRSGVVLLQSDRKDTTAIRLKANAELSGQTPCMVLAVSERRGLVLADAVVQQDPAVTGLGWLNVQGEDSPGAVGSPVVNNDGEVVAMVGMKVPLKSWMNFALPIDQAAFEASKKRGPLLPLSQLPTTPQIANVVKSPKFLDAFETLQRKRLEPALKKWISLTATYPRSAECWALLGLCASYLNAAPEALNCQRKAVALDPKSGLYWHQLALAKLREKGAEGVETLEDREALERAVQQRPNDRLALLLLASRYVRDGDYGMADETLKRLTLMAPNYAQGFYLMAYVRGRLRDYDGAESAIQRSLKLDPKAAESWYYQGLVHDWKGDYLEAAESFKKATRYRPAHPQAWLNLAHAYRKAGRPTEAREAFIAHQKVTSKD